MILLLVLLGLIEAPKPAAGGEPTMPKPWSIGDVIALEQARGFQVSPDGKWAVWEKVHPDFEKNLSVTEIHLTSLEDGSQIRLTRGLPGDGTPRWSPDGRLIAFRSSRPREAGAKEGHRPTAADDDDDEEGGGEEEGGGARTPQIWLIDPRGGEPWPLTSREKGVDDFAWLDAGRLVFTAREIESLQEKTRKQKKDDAVVVEDEKHFTATRLFTIELESKQTRRLSLNDDQIVEFAPSPDARWVVARHNVSPHYEADAREKPRFYLYDLTVKERPASRRIFSDPPFSPYGFIWARDSSGFYCLRTRTSDPVWNGAGVELLHWFDVATGSLKEVPLGWPNGVGGFVGYDVTTDGFLALLADGPINRLARYTRRGDEYTREMIDDPMASHVDRFEVGPDGVTIVFTSSTASTLRQAYAAKLAGSRLETQRALPPINQSLENRRMAHSEVRRWKGALGDEVSGILFYPLDYHEKKRYPLVLMIHGGPNDVDLDTFDESWAYAAQLVASKGAFVLKPNYHGSTNHGQAFAESIKQHYYEYEIPDILNGIDALAGEGKVDPHRLGVIGWSNGAILTWELITRTDRFKVAAPGAGDVNWTGDYGNCSFGAWFDNYYMGGPPWEKAKTYIEKSPYFRFGAVTTPTIIFFGTEDHSVDTGQGWEAYRALQQIGRAPVRFVLFPGEPHSLSRPSHQRRKLEEEIAWLDQYLFGQSDLPNEALKDGSPLDRALKLARAARDGAAFGLREKGVLVPETVLWSDAPDGPVEVGRFEVTREQYAAFDPSYSLTGQPGNLPASGILFDKARAYCEWLSEVIGRPVRLPTLTEMEKLIEVASGEPIDQWTLDHWAGYPLTPDSSRLLASKVGELPDGALLAPVGSAAPGALAPSILVYDIGGNVSEWVVDGTGSRVLGCNAAQACDKSGTQADPRADYIGIRIVVSGKTIK